MADITRPWGSAAMSNFVRRFAFWLLLLGSPAQAAISVVGTPPANTGVANNANATASLGGTTASGDLAVVWYGCDAASSCTVTTPISGYTNITSRTGGAEKIYIDYKAAGASESDPTITRTGGSANDVIFGAGIILRGANTTTPVHASTTSAPTASGASIATPALTITEDNTYVCLAFVWNANSAATAFGAYNPNGTGAWTRYTVRFATGTVYSNQALWCSLQTTATNISASSISLTGGTMSTVGRFLLVSFSAAAVTPTFTSAPAIGTRTTSAIPINATSDTTGTMYGARLTDGSGTPTCDQLEAQTATGGVQYASEAVVATVADTLTFSSITDGTVTDGYFCIEDGSGNDSAVASIANMYKQPAWTVTPNVSARAQTTHTVAFTADGAGTAYAVGCAKGKTAPSYAQVAAGQCGDGAAANANNSKSVTTSADTIVLTYATPLLVYDVYGALTYGSQTSSVTTLATEIAGAESGYTAPAAFASLCNALPCPAYKYNAENATDIIDGDYNSCTTATSPDALATTWDAAGYFSYSGSSARQLLSCKFQDVSAFGMFAGANPAGFYINNQAPVYSPPTINVVWRVGDALSFNNLDVGLVSDAEGDTLTGSNSSTGTGSGADKRPAGTSFGGSGNGVLSGTLTDVASGSYVFTATDIAGDSATLTVSWEVRAAQETVPDCATTNIPLSECDGLLEANYLQLGTITTECSELDRFDVISQNPAAGTSQDPETEIDLVIAKRCGGGGAFHWPVFEFGE